MEPINGISIEKYAQLCALMADTGGDESKEIAIAAEQGVNADDWRAAKAGWLAKMQDPADMGKTAMAFMLAMQAAQDALRGGKEPGPIEDYAKIHAHMAFRKDENGNKVDVMKILEEHGYSHPKWLEMENYWTPRTQYDATRPEFAAKYNEQDALKFKTLLQQESDRIHGITR